MAKGRFAFLSCTRIRGIGQVQLRESIILHFHLILQLQSYKLHCQNIPRGLLSWKQRSHDVLLSSPVLQCKDLQHNHDRANRRKIYIGYGNESYYESQDRASKRIATGQFEEFPSEIKTGKCTKVFFHASFSNNFPFSFSFPSLIYILN